jgi:ABC-type branched-subunit amino acid transport system substrate-binding protein
VGKTDRQHLTCRGHAGRTVRGFLGGTLVVGALVAGGGAFVGITPAAASAAAAASSSTCTTPATPTAAQLSSTTGVTSKSVTVGNVSIISGPVPGLFEGAPIGVKAYFAYINSQGGVDGRKLLVDSKDDAFSSSQNETETQEAVASDFAMVGSFSLFDGYGCKAFASDGAIPDVSVTLDSGTNALPNVFSSMPLAFGANLGPIDYFKKHFPKDLTIGTITSDVASAEAQWAGIAAAYKSQGYKVAYVDDVNPLATDFTTDVINMRKDGVNMVNLTGVDWQDAAIFVQNAATQNWHPGVIVSGGPVYADQFISHAGGPAVANGVLIGQVQALYLGQDSAHVPAVGQFLKYVKQVSPSWVPDLYTLFGWTSAELFVQALKAAGPHPTRGAVLAQLKKITSFDAEGLLAPTNPAKKLPSNCYLVAEIKNGQFQRVEPKTSGFLCNSKFYFAPGSSS